MQLPQMRLTIRLGMLVIALVAVALAIKVEIQRRADRFLYLDIYHHQACMELIVRAGGPVCKLGTRKADNDQALRMRGEEAWLNYQASEYHAKLALKYERAARAPWLPLANDPPRPPNSYPRFDFQPQFAFLESSIGGE